MENDMNQKIMDLIKKMYDSNETVDEMSTSEVIENFGDCNMVQFSHYTEERLKRFEEIDKNLALEQQKNNAELQTTTIAEYGQDYEQMLKEVEEFNKTVRNIKRQNIEYSSED